MSFVDGKINGAQAPAVDGVYIAAARDADLHAGHIIGFDGPEQPFGRSNSLVACGLCANREPTNYGKQQNGQNPDFGSYPRAPKNSFKHHLNKHLRDPITEPNVSAKWIRGNTREMEYRKLGARGPEVSKLCLGTMMFGGRCNDATAKKIVDHAHDVGVNFIDTADVYAKGKSERITGKLIRRHRDHWVLATKVGNNMGPGRRGLGREWIKRACDDSLKRLKTDYIDVYYMHLDDMSVDMEETLKTMAELIKAGKVRHWAFSNFRAWRIAEMVGICDRLKLPKPACGQPYYNAMNRMPEVEYLPCCESNGIGVVPYSPLSRGILTGKYDPKSAPGKGTRAGANDERMLTTEWRKESLIIAQKIKKYAEKRGMKPGHLAVNWVLNNQLVTSVIAGPRTFAQWKDYLAALKHDFTAQDEALIDKLVAPGHPSTPGYTDPKYPVMGRTPFIGGNDEQA